MNPEINKLKSMLSANNPGAMAYLAELTAECKSPSEKEQLAVLVSQLLSQTSDSISKIENEINEYNTALNYIQNNTETFTAQ